MTTITSADPPPSLSLSTTSSYIKRMYIYMYSGFTWTTKREIIISCNRIDCSSGRSRAQIIFRRVD